MPHVIVKLYPGRGEEQKQALADAVAATVVEHLGCDLSVVSVALQEIAPEDWEQQVQGPDIVDRGGLLFVKPGT